MGNVLDSCNQRSTQQCMKSGVAKHLGVAEILQQNGLVNETNVTLFAKEQEGIVYLGYKVRENKFLGVQVRKRQGCSRCASTEKGFLSYLIVWVRDKV
nr:hypothetical protein [Tanacetum cinerariifolium]